MKKLLLLVLSAFCLLACSVDSIETDLNDNHLIVMDASFDVDGCSVITFNYAEAGRIEMRNDPDFIYVKLIANGDYDIVQSNLHIATDISGFPTSGSKHNPGINIKDMAHQLEFSPTVKEYEYKFPISTFGDSFLVAANTVFVLGKKSQSLWTGDVATNKWTYFAYELKDHPYYAGADNSRDLSLSEAQVLPSWDEVRKVYTAMLEPGVPNGHSVGTFEPSIWDLINRFNDPIFGGVGVYTTVYTLGEGECSDSVTLTLNVVPDGI